MACVVKNVEAVLQRGCLFYVLWAPRLLIRRHPHSRAGRRCGLRRQKCRGSLTARLSLFYVLWTPRLLIRRRPYSRAGRSFACREIIRVPGDDAARVVKNVEAVLHRGCLFYVLWTPRLLIRRHPHSRAGRRCGSRCQRCRGSLTSRLSLLTSYGHPGY